jgi:hypothetical protein
VRRRFSASRKSCVLYATSKPSADAADVDGGSVKQPLPAPFGRYHRSGLAIPD